MEKVKEGRMKGQARTTSGGMSPSDVSRIELVLKENVRDVLGERIEHDAARYLGIETGAVRTAKVFVLTHRLSDEEIGRFAIEGLEDQIIHDSYINTCYENPLYKSYLLVAKLPGVTDDEGVSAERTLCDLLERDYDPSYRRIFSQEVYYIERELSDDQLRRLGEDLIGNVLVNHFEFGPTDGRETYVPEVKILADDTTATINIFVPDEELLGLSKEMVLSLSLEELRAIQDYYKDPDVLSERKRHGLPDLPTDCELEVLAQTWSEHCKHKEFNAIIEYTDSETGKVRTIDSLFRTFIKGSTDVISARLSETGNNWLIKVFADNAGVVRIVSFLAAFIGAVVFSPLGDAYGFGVPHWLSGITMLGALLLVPALYRRHDAKSMLLGDALAPEAGPS